MPKRTEIELSPSHWQRLSQLAKRRKKSVSQLIADAVDQYLQREQQSDWEERKRRALAAVGRFPAAPDLAEKHDEYYKCPCAVFSTQRATTRVAPTEARRHQPCRGRSCACPIRMLQSYRKDTYQSRGHSLQKQARLKTSSLRFPLRAGGTEPVRGSPREAGGTCRRGAIVNSARAIGITDRRVSC